MLEILSFVGQLVATVVVLALVARVRSRRAAAAARRHAAGGVASFAVRAEGDHPYPREWTRAHVVVAGRTVTLHPAGGAPVPLPAGPLEVRRARAARPADALPDHGTSEWCVVVAQDGDGRLLRLAVVDEEAEALVRVLRTVFVVATPGEDPDGADAGALAAPRTARLPFWTVLVGAGGVLAVVVTALAWWAATPVVTTVDGPVIEEWGYCPVTWSDPRDGTEQHAQISCAGEEVGETVAGLAPAFPFRGEVVDTETFPVLLGLAIVPLVVAAAGAAWSLLRPRLRGRFWTRLPGWSIAVGVPAVLLTVLVAGLWLGSERVVLSVQDGPDGWGMCPVAWTDPWDGLPQEAQISCEVPAGSVLTGEALPFPWRGDVFDTASFPGLLAACVALLLVAAAGPLLRGRTTALRRTAAPPRQDRDAATWTAVPEAALDVDLLQTGATDVAAAVRDRADVEGWAQRAPEVRPLAPERALAGPWWTVPGLDRQAVRAATSGWFVLPFCLLLAALSGWSAWGGWLGTRDATATAVTTEAEVVDGFDYPLVPDDLRVRFTTEAGREVVTLVAWTGDERPGAVTVRYGVEDPTRATAVGEGDGTGRGLLLSTLLVVLPLSWPVLQLVRASRHAAVLRRSLASPSTSARYLLTRDEDDDFTLLLLDDDEVRWAVALAGQEAGRLPVHGAAALHGPLEPGGCVVPVVDGRVWWPIGPLTPTDPDLVRYLVTGEVPDEEPDLEDDPDRP